MKHSYEIILMKGHFIPSDIFTIYWNEFSFVLNSPKNLTNT